MLISKKALGKWSLGSDHSTVGLEAVGTHREKPGKATGASGKCCVLGNAAINREDLFPLGLC